MRRGGVSVDPGIHRRAQAFGKAIADFQNTRFKLAEMATEIPDWPCVCGQVHALHLEGKLDVPTAAMAKYWATDLQCKVLDECVQLHGGYGFMWNTRLPGPGRMRGCSGFMRGPMRS